jgi:hypothetical protein
VQVPVQQPPQRRLPLGFAVLGLGAPAGVQAQQVVKAEPAGCVLSEQVRASQPIQQLRR